MTDRILGGLTDSDKPSSLSKGVRINPVIKHIVHLFHREETTSCPILHHQGLKIIHCDKEFAPEKNRHQGKEDMKKIRFETIHGFMQGKNRVQGQRPGIIFDKLKILPQAEGTGVIRLDQTKIFVLMILESQMLEEPLAVHPDAAILAGQIPRINDNSHATLPGL